MSIFTHVTEQQHADRDKKIRFDGKIINTTIEIGIFSNLFGLLNFRRNRTNRIQIPIHHHLIDRQRTTRPQVCPLSEFSEKIPRIIFCTAPSPTAQRSDDDTQEEQVQPPVVQTEPHVEPQTKTLNPKNHTESHVQPQPQMSEPNFIFI
jgi:hypothetical protein